MRSSGYYIDKFIALRAASDMLQLKLFPNAKEITESYAMLEASRLLPYDFTKKEVTIAVIGDGTRPRTDALFAFLTKWDCYSVDPSLHGDYPIQRLTVIPKQIEQIKLHFEGNLVIVLPHSHARMKHVLSNLTCSGTRSVLSMPCCVNHNIEGCLAEEFTDDYVWSAKKLVKLWRFT